MDFDRELQDLENIDRSFCRIIITGIIAYWILSIGYSVFLNFF